MKSLRIRDLGLIQSLMQVAQLERIFLVLPKMIFSLGNAPTIIQFQEQEFGAEVFSLASAKSENRLDFSFRNTKFLYESEQDQNCI